MSKVRHTRGPWVVLPSHPGDGGSGPCDRVIVGDYFVETDDETGDEWPSCTVVAHVKGNPTSGKVTETNARLIAAAPDLLAACKALSSLAFGIGSRTADEKEVQKAFTDCRAAITKAEPV